MPAVVVIAVPSMNRIGRRTTDGAAGASTSTIRTFVAAVRYTHDSAPAGEGSPVKEGSVAADTFGQPGDYAEAVLDLVERIPSGRVMTYGDIAEYLGQGGPRQVGRVMSHWGGGVPWWRVIRADGHPPIGHEERALRRYRIEGTPMRPDGIRVDMRRARWIPDG